MSDLTYEAYKCPECGNLQINADDCEGCSFGGDEEGWTSVVVEDNEEGDMVEA